jgi:hypothetical protein
VVGEHSCGVMEHELPDFCQGQGSFAATRQRKRLRRPRTAALAHWIVDMQDGSWALAAFTQIP